MMTLLMIKGSVADFLITQCWEKNCGSFYAVLAIVLGPQGRV